MKKKIQLLINSGILEKINLAITTSLNQGYLNYPWWEYLVLYDWIQENDLARELDPTFWKKITYDEENLAQKIQRLINLKVLAITDGKHLKIIAISPLVGKLKNLEVLSCSFQNLKTFPKEIKYLKHIKKFSFASPKLEEYPDFLAELPCLEHLSINVSVLYDWKNKLSGFPKKLALCSTLISLYVYNTKLKTGEVDDVLKGLPLLETLWLDNCELKEFPQEVKNLRNLKSLSLRGNFIETLPNWLEEMKNLEILFIENNPLKAIPLFSDSFRKEKVDIFNPYISTS
ncbi:MAG: leucine-rich repeat domain-containing protein [Aureispira sp.]|nr:leucine-rich repeat domain-containing protein [Aureispira sp.]